MLVNKSSVIDLLSKVKQILYNNRVTLISFLLILLILSPLIVNGTFYVDDWDFVEVANRLNVIEAIKFQWISIGYRPFTALILSIVPCLFGQNYWLYAILNVSVIFIAFSIIINILGKYIGIKDAHKRLIVQPVFFLAFISTTFIFSPVTHIVTAVSLLMWALSLLFVDKYIKTNNFKYVLLSAISVFVGVLCYEIFLPLLVFNILIILGAGKIKSPKLLIKSTWRISVSYVAVLFFALIYQKYIATLLGANTYSRVVSQSVESIIKNTIINLHNLSLLLIKDIPEASKLAISYSFKNWFYILLSIIVALVVSFSFYNVLSKIKRIDIQQTKRLIFAAIISLIVSSVFVALSRYPLTIEGYSNRMMFPFWVGLCLLLIGLVMRFKKHLSTYVLIFIIVFTLCMSYLGVQAEFTKASELRKYIGSDIAEKVINSREKGVIVLANVPRCITQPIINIEVFSVIWDIDGMLDLSMARGVIAKTAIIQQQNHDYKPWYEINDSQMKLFGWWTLSADEINKVFLYTYNIADGSTSLVKAKNWSDVKNFTSTDNVKSNQTCRSVFNYGKAEQDLRAFLSNYLSD